ncbi:hypothetical protein BA190_17390 [Labrys sp. WJW]|nr:hypothetical protein BA190_17390 [Labrys sp. WJW]
MFMVRTRCAVFARKPPSLWSYQDKGARALQCRCLVEHSVRPSLTHGLINWPLRIAGECLLFGQPFQARLRDWDDVDDVSRVRADIAVLVAASAVICRFLIESG